MRRSRFIRAFLLAFGLLSAVGPALAAGTIPLSLVQQIDTNGQPLAGCLLYSYVAGTVATPQNSFADFGLTQANPNPLECDQSGRVPMAWYADGLIKIRLTDSSGVVVIDTTMQVLGPSSGGGGGGGTIDPTTIASTGDIKFRATSETLAGWVVLNGQTIGSASSGATGRANADTQNLFIYLWNNCIDAHCPVIGGRGSTGLADFNANKQMTMPDMRGSILAGRDCMGTSCSGRISPVNVTSGGGDNQDTAGAFGGFSTVTLGVGNLPNYNLPFSLGVSAGQWTHTHGVSGGTIGGTITGANNAAMGGGAVSYVLSGAGIVINSATLPALSVNTGFINSSGSNAAFATMNPFKLGNFFIKL